MSTTWGKYYPEARSPYWWGGGGAGQRRSACLDWFQGPAALCSRPQPWKRGEGESTARGRTASSAEGKPTDADDVGTGQMMRPWGASIRRVFRAIIVWSCLAAGLIRNSAGQFEAAEMTEGLVILGGAWALVPAGGRSAGLFRLSWDSCQAPSTDDSWAPAPET